MPWSIIFNFSTSCTFTELYNSIKNEQSASDGWSFLEKYDKCSVSAVVELMKFFEKRITSAKKKPPSLIHFFYKIGPRT
jgi:hypothetical protein